MGLKKLKFLGLIFNLLLIVSLSLSQSFSARALADELTPPPPLSSAPTIKTVTIDPLVKGAAPIQVELFFENGTLSYFRVDNDQPVEVAAEVAALFSRFQDHEALLRNLAQSNKTEDQQNFVRLIAPENEALVTKFATALRPAVEKRAPRDEKASGVVKNLTRKSFSRINTIALVTRRIAIIVQTFVIFPAAWMFLGLSFHDAISALPTVIVSDLFVFAVTTGIAAMTRWSVKEGPPPGRCEEIMGSLIQSIFKR